MGLHIYRRRTDLWVDVQPDGWARVCRPGDEVGIALDPQLFAIWSAADQRTSQGVAASLRISNYLASSALTVLWHGGLLEGESGAPLSCLNTGLCPLGHTSVSALIVRHNPRADLDVSVGSVLNQGYPAFRDLVVVGGSSTSCRQSGVTIIRSEEGTWLDLLLEFASKTTADAVLVLDSRVSLALGALAEMVYALELRNDIVAVTPRIMWSHWPSFVVELGDWSRARGTSRSPYAGHLDVGQFRRWQEVPAIGSWSGLLSSGALREIAQRKGDGTAAGLDEWCLQARMAGRHIVAATYALAYGPWRDPAGQPGEASEATRVMERRSRTSESVDQLPEIPVRYAQWPGGLPALEVDGMLHEGRPALTIEGVRGLYSHYPAVAPLPVRRRVAFVGQEGLRHRRMAQQLSSGCDVHWVPSCEAEDDEAVLSCRAADVLITTPDSLMRCSFLQQTDQPMLVDTQSPAKPTDEGATTERDPLLQQVGALEKTPWDWLEVADGIVCASEEERLFWLGALAARDRLNPYTKSAFADLRDLVMVVPTGVEAVPQPSESVLKGVHPGVDAEDKVILWWGPLRAFDDPLTAICAFKALSSFRDHLKLVFAAFGGQADDAETLQSAMQLVKDLGLTERVLFERQVPRHLRDGYLSEADLAVALGKQMLEAQLSGPVALSACIGAGLPLIVTDRHAGSELIQQHALGQPVSCCDIEAVAEALSVCLERPRDAYSEAFAEAKQALAWPQVMSPLADFCQQPHHALDRLVGKFLLCEAPTPPPAEGWLLALLIKAWRLHQQQGLRATISEVWQYIRWRVGV